MNVGDYEPAKLKEVMDKEKMNWSSTADRGGAIAARWNQPGTPLYYVLDPQGVIRYKWYGYPGEKTLDDALEKLIVAAERSKPPQK